MKELFNNLNRHYLYKHPKGLILLDSCFFINMFDQNQHTALEEFCEHHSVAITSFNVEEVLFNLHRFRDKTQDHMRAFLKNTNLSVLDISLSPGVRTHEEAYINTVDPELLAQVHDPSDAVLVATAIKTNSAILTKDKHHLFTAQLENFLNKYDIRVYKSIKDLM